MRLLGLLHYLLWAVAGVSPGIVLYITTCVCSLTTYILRCWQALILHHRIIPLKIMEAIKKKFAEESPEDKKTRQRNLVLPSVGCLAICTAMVVIGNSHIRKVVLNKFWYTTLFLNFSRVLKDLIWTDQIRSKNHYFNDLDLILDQHLSRWSWSDLRSFLRMIWSEMI